jgi:aspartate kinase
MKVFKFGGASVKNADAVRNVVSVINRYPNDKLMVVVSAMGKTTNAFEMLLNAWYYNESMVRECLQEIVDYHNEIIRDLFPNFSDPIYTDFAQWLDDLESYLAGGNNNFYDYDYDGLVGKGELLSTRIITRFLQLQGKKAVWQDARKMIRTNNIYRDGRVDWTTTEQLTQKIVKVFLADNNIIVTQGFIASTQEGLTTTLGREGSDYTASILAYCNNAESVTIWKDVPGVLNADPKWFDNTVKLDKISYREATELSYYGASIIHPKTIKPLENKKIPLYAKSFLNPEAEGTVIQESQDYDTLVPSFIFKINQILISISTKDFSFVVEENLQDIFKLFTEHRVNIRLMQNSALNFSVCADMDDRKIPAIIKALQEDYKVLYNNNLELVTIRHFDEATIERVTLNKKILVDQRTRNTARMVMETIQ